MTIKDDEVRTAHPAFGQISVSYVSGRQNLFMVDYPQQHFISLRIKKAELIRNLSNDWVFDKEEIIEVDMSEVQWARLVASPNTAGVPCTLSRYRDPKSGEWIRPVLPDRHAANGETFHEEIKKAADKASTQLREGLEALDALLAGGPIKKGDLQKAREKVWSAQASLTDSLPWVVEQAGESIAAATQHGKAEIDAHFDFALNRLGQAALGDRLQAAIKNDVDMKQIGKKVAEAVTDINPEGLQSPGNS